MKIGQKPRYPCPQTLFLAHQAALRLVLITFEKELSRSGIIQNRTFLTQRPTRGRPR